MTTDPDIEIHDCGYIEGTFACRIRHINMNAGAAKAVNDFREKVS